MARSTGFNEVGAETRKMTDTVDEQEVRQRAYRLWEQHGRPSGRDNEFWFRAEREVQQGEGEAVESAPRDQKGESRGIAPAPSGMEQTDDQDNLHNNVSNIGGSVRAK
jgi:hypothetical protein